PAGVLQAVFDGLIGKHVQLLLFLALDVLVSSRAQNVHHAGPPNGGCDDLACLGDDTEQVGKLAGCFWIPVLLVQNEPLDCGDGCLQAPSSTVLLNAVGDSAAAGLNRHLSTVGSDA